MTQRIVPRSGSICFRMKASSTVVQWLTPSPHSQQVPCLAPGLGWSAWSLFVLPLSVRVPSGYFGFLRSLVCSHMQHLQIINNLILEKYLQRDKHIFWSLNFQAKFKVCLHHHQIIWDLLRELYSGCVDFAFTFLPLHCEAASAECCHPTI